MQKKKKEIKGEANIETTEQAHTSKEVISGGRAGVTEGVSREILAEVIPPTKYHDGA